MSAKPSPPRAPGPAREVSSPRASRARASVTTLIDFTRVEKKARSSVRPPAPGTTDVVEVRDVGWLSPRKRRT